MKQLLNHFLSILAAVILTACATSPEFDTTGIDRSLSPKQSVTEITLLRGRPILWGGVIISSINLEQATQFEILAYPLDSDYRPDTNAEPSGRFLATQPGYLETANFAQGRLLTVRGTLKDTRSGKIGDSEYTYPVISIDQLHLWPKQGVYSEPRIQFGIGVFFHN